MQEILLATHARWPNRKVMGAFRVDEKGQRKGGLQRVRVRNNRRFKAGMGYACRQVRADLWDLAQKWPKAAGRDGFVWQAGKGWVWR